jgi:hypothetical protein
MQRVSTKRLSPVIQQAALFKQPKTNSLRLQTTSTNYSAVGNTFPSTKASAASFPPRYGAAHNQSTAHKGDAAHMAAKSIAHSNLYFHAGDVVFDLDTNEKGKVKSVSGDEHLTVLVGHQTRVYEARYLQTFHFES